MPRILLSYIGRQYLFWFASLLMVLAGVIGVFELIELLRRMSGRETASFGAAVAMAAFKLPQTLDKVFHFTVLFSAMFTFWRLTRSQELVIMRASGLSAWQFILPVLAAAIAIGIVKTTVYNPVAAELFDRYERLESTYLGAGADSFKISPGGLWLREPTSDGMAVIHAARADPASMELQRVVVLRFDRNEHFIDRLDTETMHLEPGHWRIDRALVTSADTPSRMVRAVELPTTLTRETIQERFSSPETTGFWDLPDYIRTLEETGFTAVRYRLAYQSMLSQPLLLAAMVLFAAAFSLRHPRRGRALLMVAAGMTTGFLLLMLTDVVTAYGIAQTIPVPMAAWTPALVSLLVGTATLLHLEDG